MTGLAAGIGAIFHAPLAGAVLGAELLYRRGASWPVLLPAFGASAVAFGLFGLVYGHGPLFGDVAAGLTGITDLVLIAALGLACGLLGRAYIVTFSGTHRLVGRLVRPTDDRRGLSPYLPAALGGLAVGLIGIAVPEILGPGYGVIQRGFDATVVLEMSLWVVLALPLLKIAATSLSIGTGGSGGLFGPGLFIGAAGGVALWRVADALDLTAAGPASFAIIGAAAVLGPVIHAPIGVALLVMEATRSPALVGSVVLALIVARCVVGGARLYRSQPDKEPRLGRRGKVEATVP